MTGPPAATAAVRVAVRRALAGVDGPVTAAVSGGADSLALAAALAFERPGSGAVVVDHGLQDGSPEVAAKAAAQCAGLGLAARVLTGAGGRRGGPEAAARELRYALLDTVDGTVLLGHTRDDQAETVLLGLLRGSGTRAASGMAGVRGRYRRPFLDLSRATTRQACAEAGLTPWEDPHNDDEAYTRVRVRQLLGALRAKDLDLTDGLARSARLLREDADALDALTTPTDEVAELLVMAPALRSRALKAWAEQQCGQALASAHVDALRTLVEDWRGQGPVALPGGGVVAREGGRLAFWT
jgi:tRNA(Ile)-lysidine synthase